MAELASCGGYMGVTIGNANATQGVDCSTLPGVALGASTCTLGQCQVFSCEPGFTLVGDACVAGQVLTVQV
ncbi:hypothetical protein Q5752_001475 [Cryptotrichosporon argae]